MGSMTETSWTTRTRRFARLVAALVRTSWRAWRHGDDVGRTKRLDQSGRRVVRASDRGGGEHEHAPIVSARIRTPP